MKRLSSFKFQDKGDDNVDNNGLGNNNNGALVTLSNNPKKKNNLLNSKNNLPNSKKKITYHEVSSRLWGFLMGAGSGLAELFGGYMAASLLTGGKLAPNTEGRFFDQEKSYNSSVNTLVEYENNAMTYLNNHTIAYLNNHK